MPFQIKDFASIVSAQINHARSVTTKITDFQPGSVARTLMEAPAVELEELYLQMFLGLRDAIPVATFLSFGFDKLPAATAHGFVSVSKDPAPVDDIPVPVGTTFSTADGRSYASTQAVTWASGEDSVRIPVACTVPGAVGNAEAGLITSSPAFGTGFAVSNAAILTGRDEESDAEREARFAEFIGSLSAGTVAACLYAAKQASVLDEDGNIFEYVTRAGLTEVPGRVAIYVYSSRGVPSAGLISDGQLRLDGSRNEDGSITPGYRSAGVRVDVLPMAERAVDLSIAVGLSAGYSLTAEVQQDLTDAYGSALRAVLPGETLYLGTLTESLLAVDGVVRVVPSGTSNIVCQPNEALVPGALTISAL